MSMIAAMALSGCSSAPTATTTSEGGGGSTIPAEAVTGGAGGGASSETPVTPDLTPTAGETGMEMGHGDATYTFGEPGDAATATRVIEIKTLDTLKFEPAAVEIKLGETVTFRVTNSGLLAHDFTLGDEALQKEHEAEMAKMAATGAVMPDEPNAFILQAGQTKEITWKFTQPGEVLYGCHTPGHFAAGMVGIGHITVK